MFEKGNEILMTECMPNKLSIQVYEMYQAKLHLSQKHMNHQKKPFYAQ